MLLKTGKILYPSLGESLAWMSGKSMAEFDEEAVFFLRLLRAGEKSVKLTSKQLFGNWLSAKMPFDHRCH